MVKNYHKIHDSKTKENKYHISNLELSAEGFLRIIKEQKITF